MNEALILLLIIVVAIISYILGRNDAETSEVEKDALRLEGGVLVYEELEKWNNYRTSTMYSNYLQGTDDTAKYFKGQARLNVFYDGQGAHGPAGPMTEEAFERWIKSYDDKMDTISAEELKIRRLEDEKYAWLN